MDKKYTTPEIVITKFETEDVITTSGGANGNDEYEHGGNVID